MSVSEVCPKCEEKLLKLYTRNPNTMILPFYICLGCFKIYHYKLEGFKFNELNYAKQDDSEQESKNV